MASVIHTNIQILVAVLRARLQARLAWPAERVLVVADDFPPFHGQADQYARIRIGRQRPVLARTGGGRLTPRVERHCTVALFTRLQLDEPTQDAQLMTHLTLGLFVPERALLDTLDGWIPTADGTDGGNWLCYEPVVLSEAGEAEKEKDTPGWAQAAYRFTLAYTLDFVVSTEADL